MKFFNANKTAYIFLIVFVSIYLFFIIGGIINSIVHYDIDTLMKSISYTMKDYSKRMPYLINYKLRYDNTKIFRKITKLYVILNIDEGLEILNSLEDKSDTISVKQFEENFHIQYAFYNFSKNIEIIKRYESGSKK